MNIQKIFILLVALMSACFVGVVVMKKNHINQQKQLIIVATTSMLADAVRNIVGDQMIVHGLMGCGIDPHVYRARESDVHKLAGADLVIYNGLHLEGKMGQVLEGMNRFTKVINVSHVIDKQNLRTADFDELYDPHIWFDVRLWISVVRYIQDAIIQLDKEHADIYKKNGNAYVEKLKQLDIYVQQRATELQPQQRILVTAHDAFGYFGDAYGFEVVGLQGLSTDSDISTRDIQQLVDYIVEKRISTIFIESSIPARSLMAVQQAVVAEGWQIAIGEELYSDALGDEESGAATYIDMVKHNVDIIVDSLSICQK
jgi:manganese/zinc/iron transport system substrate-binding protein